MAQKEKPCQFLSVDWKVTPTPSARSQAHQMFQTLAAKLRELGVYGEYHVRIDAPSNNQGKDNYCLVIRSDAQSAPHAVCIRMWLSPREGAFNGFIYPTKGADKKDVLFLKLQGVMAGENRIIFSEDLENIPLKSVTSVAPKPNQEIKNFTDLPSTLPTITQAQPATHAAIPQKDEERRRQSGLSLFLKHGDNLGLFLHQMFALSMATRQKAISFGKLLNEMQAKWGSQYEITSMGVRRAVGITGRNDGHISREVSSVHGICYYITAASLTHLISVNMVTIDESRAYSKLPIFLEEVVNEPPSTATVEEKLRFLEECSRRYRFCVEGRDTSQRDAAAAIVEADCIREKIKIADTEVKRLHNALTLAQETLRVEGENLAEIEGEMPSPDKTARLEEMLETLKPYHEKFLRISAEL